MPVFLAKMKSSILLSTFAAGLVSAQGSLTNWTAPGPTDCTYRKIPSVHIILISHSSRPMPNDEYVGQSWLSPSRRQEPYTGRCGWCFNDSAQFQWFCCKHYVHPSSACEPRSQCYIFYAVGVPLARSDIIYPQHAPSFPSTESATYNFDSAIC